MGLNRRPPTSSLHSQEGLLRATQAVICTDGPRGANAGIPGLYPERNAACYSCKPTAGAWQWCEPEAQLQSIFQLSHLPASQLQDEGSCRDLVEIVVRFVRDLSQGGVWPQGELCAPDGVWTQLEPRDVAALQTAADVLRSGCVVWYPEFGCALLGLSTRLLQQHDAVPDGSRPDVGADDLALTLIALDEWRFTLHSSPRQDQHTATVTGHASLCCGTIKADDFDTMRAVVAHLITRRLEKKQKNNQKGFQRTPAFIEVVIADAVDFIGRHTDGAAALQAIGGEAKEERLLLPETMPRGGFTDTGRHTGNDTVRDTCWPLVASSLQAVLTRCGPCGGSPPAPPALLFRQALAHLDLWLLRRQLAYLTHNTATPAVLTAVMGMLRAAASKAAALAAEGYDMAAFEGACAAAEQYIHTAAGQRALAAGRRFELPMRVSPRAVGAATPPTGTLPPALEPGVADDGLTAARRRAERNLGSLPLLPPGASLQQILTLQQHPAWAKPHGDVATQLVLRSVERELFRRAANGFEAPANQLNGHDIATLEQIVDSYRATLAAFLASPASQACMRVELLSRELLVVWVAYCLTHAAACREHTVVSRYGVFAPHHELRHLVLSDRAAVDASLSVAAYLQRCSVSGRALFSLLDGGAATMAMAREFAGACPRLQGIWAAEQADAAARMQGHWAEVRRKQALAAEKRRLVQGLEQEVSTLLVQQSAHAYWSSAYKSLDAQLYSKQSALSSARQQLADAERPPSPVLQPLPRKTEAALEWLFFLHMPPLLRRLGRASFHAQQLLIPRPCRPEVANVIAVTGMNSSLVGYYNSMRTSSPYLPQPQQQCVGADGAVMLYSQQVPPRSDTVKLSHIDSYRSRDDGVYWPDALVPHMVWGGTGTAADQGQGFPPFFNPYAFIASELVEKHFTERLPGGAESLQWAMHVRGSAAGTPADRGNVPIAQQDIRPTWLSKPAFLELGSMRAYPLRQLRRLCAALHDRTLPLAHPAVQLLLRQLLFHIGTLTSDNPPALLWRTGWELEGDVLQTLCAELASLAEELETTPRQHDAVQLLGEGAAYLADWHAPCRTVARRFANLARAAAEQLEPGLAAAASSGDDDAVSELLARQVRLRAMALLCYGAGPLAVEGSAARDLQEDAGAMVELIVLVRHGSVFLRDAELLAELEALQIRAHNVVASRIAFLTDAVRTRTHMLTAAVACVMQQRTPAQLAWRQLGSEAGGGGLGSWEAVGSDGRLYSINLLDGTVLFDGWPPSRLPKEVTDHPLYRRVFGSFNFEVAFKGGADGAAGRTLQSLRPIQGRLYDFCTAADGQELSVTEVDVEHGGMRLELLDVGKDGGCGQWGPELPARLQELHSHWYCRDRSVVLLRPHDFQRHDTHFLIECVEPASGSNTGPRWEYTCWRVPGHLAASTHWTELLTRYRGELTDRLVRLHGSHVLDTILAKFEDVRYIHAYVTHGSSGSGTQTLLFELPRFGLEFELRDGHLVSRDYAGYRLRRRQQLVSQAVGCDFVEYTLPEFQQYLVLKRSPGEEVHIGARLADVLVLVPGGEVVNGPALAPSAPTGLVRISNSSASNAQLKAHCYEVHGRFGHLRAASIPARLQLAALYAATGTLLPEPTTAATGAQLAMQLLRQCWSSRPLTAEELAQLNSVGALGGHLAPGLRLLASDLRSSAAKLAHLHPPTAVTAGAGPGSDAGGNSGSTAMLDRDAAKAYWREVDTDGRPGGWWRGNVRQQLTRGEEQWLMGMSREARQEEPAWKRQRQYAEVHVDEPFPVSAAFVTDTEALLLSLVHVKASRDAGNPAGQAMQPSASSPPPYPLTQASTASATVVSPASGQAQSYATDAGANNGTPLEREMHAELAASWEIHHSMPSLDALSVPPQALDVIRKALADTCERREEAEAYLLRHLHRVSDGVGCHGPAFRLFRLAGKAAAAAALDLIRAAVLGPECLLEFNPFLSALALKQLYGGILVWLQLCVLEDRLGRLAQLAAAGEDCRPQLVQELQVRRVWDPSTHPQWLAFEVEGRLQIRPAQYAVAAHLMGHPGAIAQLNMGEGKTRVILPMLALHWADGSRVVRLNLLSTLLDEAYGHLQQHLAAGVLGRKLFTLPFHRDVKLTPRSARAMLECIRYCQQEGGLLLVAPEHRLSLELKRHELWAAGAEREAEAAALGSLANLPYLDLLDESDELLHHRYQLIYACGAPIGLPASQQRFAAVQAILRIASHLASSDQLGLPNGTALLEPVPGGPPGAFCGLRLLPGEALAAAAPGLQRRLAEELLLNPPYELAWLRAHPEPAMLLECITDASRSVEDILSVAAAGLSADQVSMLLALRGLLGCGLLQHCLQRRHRVEFGVSRPAAPPAGGRRRTRMAVPFRAAHTPSERSEFAQPDVALLLTHLAYYYDGLSRPEFEAALRTLLTLGPNARRAFYDGWLALSRARIPAEDLAAMDCVAKLDTSNPQQMALMHAYMSHNMAAVDFWLSYCVLPMETRQFPQRLAASAWHLADSTANGQVVGFSGTNDNYRLLPLQVQQAQVGEPALAATNGKMLDVILKTSLGYTTLPPAGGEQSAWRTLLDTAVSLRMDALLDCGALLAGVSNRGAADYLIGQLPRNRFQGVTYFDEQLRSWTVADGRGRRMPRHSSPIAERDTFVIFDDARCRGADLQLRRGAVGLLTLGPGACKDKVMQAAGRLRQLGRGQRLHFAAAPDITAKILRLSGATAGHGAGGGSVNGYNGGGGSALGALQVLRWVMANTVAATHAGVLSWASQGLHFAATRGAPERALQPEPLQLSAFYGDRKALLPVWEVVAARAAVRRRHCLANGGLGEDMGSIMSHIVSLSAAHGEGHMVPAGGAGGGGAAEEECERELEEEEEEEQEVERQVQRVTPARERDWDYAAAWRATSLAQLGHGGAGGGDLRILALPAVVKALAPASLQELAWPETVCCTSNFLVATGTLAANAPLNEYLRPVDALLLFPSGELLMVSEREADQLLAAAWEEARMGRSRDNVSASGGGRVVITAEPRGEGPVLLSLCYARLTFQGGQAPVLTTSASGVAPGTVMKQPPQPPMLQAREVVAVQLFAGEASYGGEAQRGALRALVARRLEAAEALLDMRGRLETLPYSDLEREAIGFHQTVLP